MKPYALALPCLFATLIFATISCTETAPTGPDVEVETEVGVSKRPGGGRGDFTNWAYVAVKGNNVALSSVDGNHSRTIVRGGNADRYSPRFTDDGSEIAYLTPVVINGILSDQLRIVGVDGSNDRLLFSFHNVLGPKYGSFDWLPGGSKIIYNGGMDLAVLDTQEGEVQLLDWPSLFPGDGGGREVSPGPDLEPDTKGFQGPIVAGWFSRNNSEGDLYVVMAEEDPMTGQLGFDPSTLVQLELPDVPNNSGSQNQPVFSPDGSAIAFLDKAYCCSGEELSVVPFNAATWSFGEPELLASTANTPSLVRIGYQPAWAPDGPDGSPWIAYTGYFTGKGPYLTGKLVLVHPDTTEANILPKSAPYSHPDWNPLWDPSGE